MDRLAALEAFVRVAECGSFSKAANRLHSSKSVVSRFKERILQLPRRDRIRIYYYYCLHIDVFENDPRFSIEYLDLIPDGCSARRRETLERFLEPAAVIRLKGTGR